MLDNDSTRHRAGIGIMFMSIMFAPYGACTHLIAPVLCVYFVGYVLWIIPKKQTLPD